MSNVGQKHPLRWFLLFWIGLLFLQGLVESADQGLFIGLLHLAVMSSLTLIFFTVIMVIHISLHGLTLFGYIRQSKLFAYFLGQGLLALLILLLADRRFVVFGLCLVLTIEAIHLLRWTRWLMLVVSGYLALYVFAVQPQTYFLNTDMEGSFIKSIDSLALILFAAACVFLYSLQAQAHRRDQEILHELEQAHTQLETAHAQLATTHTQLETAHIQLEDYAARVEALTLLTERQRLARELHDTLAQGLVGLTMQLETVNGLLARAQPRQAQDIVQQSLYHTRASLAAARSVIDDLRHESLDEETFLTTLQQEIQLCTASSNLRCATDMEILATVPPMFYEPIVRFVGEALTNIVRHARAQRIWIQARRVQQHLLIDVSDDGIGFDPTTAVTTPGHYGLLGLRERAQLLGGILQMHSKSGSGTTLIFILPVQPASSTEQAQPFFRNSSVPL